MFTTTTSTAGLAPWRSGATLNERIALADSLNRVAIVASVLRDAALAANTANPTPATKARANRAVRAAAEALRALS